MRLSSKIISQNSSELRKELQCYFDHPVELIYDQSTLAPPLASLAAHDIVPYLISEHQDTPHNQCIVAYKYSLDSEQLLRIAREVEGLDLQILEYNHKGRNMQAKLKSPVQGSGQLKFGEESTVIVELKSAGKTTKAYLLPFSRGEEETLVSRAIHENFKILKVVRQFVMLEGSWRGSLEFEEPIFRHLSAFLYGEKVRRVQTVLWIEKGQFDRKLLQQVGELKLPEPWLEKEEYRNKKEEMFEIKTEEHQLSNAFRRQKEDFCSTINFLQKLSGVTPQTYDEINLDSLKLLKQEGFIEKAAEIKELENILAKLDLRESTLKERKGECRAKMLQTQRKHVSEILALKKEIGALQQTKQEGLCSFGLIFNRSRKSTDHRVIKTIFTHVDKQAQRFNDTENQFNRISDNSDARSPRDAKKKTQVKKEEFKNNEKKVASVVKDGREGAPLDKRQLRQDYENEMLKIDFEMEKRYNDMLSRYDHAAKAIKRAMDENEEMTI